MRHLNILDNILWWILILDVLIRSMTLKLGPLAYLMGIHPLVGILCLLAMIYLMGKTLCYLLIRVRNRVSENNGLFFQKNTGQ